MGPRVLAAIFDRRCLLTDQAVHTLHALLGPEHPLLGRARIAASSKLVQRRFLIRGLLLALPRLRGAVLQGDRSLLAIS